ncbi:MAG: hypothetical protein JW936_10195, partial [Sedimentisphaerales bacterium]|nr:hypothetical protein [Sedimentisphaerales bacterium]
EPDDILDPTDDTPTVINTPQDDSPSTPFYTPEATNDDTPTDNNDTPDDNPITTDEPAENNPVPPTQSHSDTHQTYHLPNAPAADNTPDESQPRTTTAAQQQTDTPNTTQNLDSAPSSATSQQPINNPAINIPENASLNHNVQFHPNAAAFDAQMFQQQLNDFAEENQEQIESQFHLETVTVGFAAGTAGAVSLGYGLWALKGGSVIASMASGVPILSAMDPLPILDAGNSPTRARRNQKLELDTDELNISSLFK